MVYNIYMTRQKLVELKKRGFSDSEAARICGVSRQRVHQLLRGYSSKRKFMKFKFPLWEVSESKPKVCKQSALPSFHI